MTATTTNANINFINFLKCPMITGEKVQFLFNEERNTKLKAYDDPIKLLKALQLKMWLRLLVKS